MLTLGSWMRKLSLLSKQSSGTGSVMIVDVDSRWPKANGLIRLTAATTRPPVQRCNLARLVRVCFWKIKSGCRNAHTALQRHT